MVLLSLVIFCRWNSLPLDVGSNSPRCLSRGVGGKALHRLQAREGICGSLLSMELPATGCGWSNSPRCFSRGIGLIGGTSSIGCKPGWAYVGLFCLWYSLPLGVVDSSPRCLSRGIGMMEGKPSTGCNQDGSVQVSSVYGTPCH